MKKIQKALGIIFVISFVFGGVMVLPISSFALTSEPTDSSFQIAPKVSDCATVNGVQECGWTDLIALIFRIMKFVIYIAVSIGILACAYAGFLYITAFGESGKIEQAHKIFSSTIVGFLIILLAWLIVATVLKTLNVDTKFTILDTSGVTTQTTNTQDINTD